MNKIPFLILIFFFNFAFSMNKNVKTNSLINFCATSHELNNDKLTHLRLLIFLGDVNKQNHKGDSALSKACAHGNYKIAKILLLHNANINIKDEMGNSPLMYALKTGNIDLIKLLIQKGAYREDVNNLCQPIPDNDLKNYKKMLKAGDFYNNLYTNTIDLDKINAQFFLKESVKFHLLALRYIIKIYGKKPENNTFTSYMKLLDLMSKNLFKLKGKGCSFEEKNELLKKRESLIKSFNSITYTPKFNKKFLPKLN